MFDFTAYVYLIILVALLGLAFWVFGEEYLECCARVPRYIGKVHNR